MARWKPDRGTTIAEYAREVLDVFPSGRLLIGIDGIETPWPGEHGEPSSREAFARDLAAAFLDAGVPAAAVRLGDFAVPGPPPSDPERLVDVAAFRERVVVPFRRGDDLEVPSGDAESESETTFTPGDRAVLVVSGPFLHLGGLPALWHRSAWLQIARGEALHREADRTGLAEDGPELRAWRGLVDAAFARVDARKRATATFDLEDPEHPRRRFEDAC